jgi:uncharacterized protein YjbJ (UPF0337 family)
VALGTTASAGFQRVVTPVKEINGRRELSGTDSDEKTTGGVFGKVAGKAKELAGELTHNDELAREGRLQQAQSEASVEAAADRSEASVAEAQADVVEQRQAVTEERGRIEAELERTRAEQQAETDRELAEKLAVVQEAAEVGQAESVKAEQAERAEARIDEAETEEQRKNREALELEQQARAAESKADALDPKE